MVNYTMILATETEGLSRLFDLDFQLLADTVLMIIAMFVLFLVASHFLFNPVRKLLNDRKEKIKGELDQAASDQKSAGPKVLRGSGGRGRGGHEGVCANA